MRITIISPLYPPDIAPLAVYVKELGVRLRNEAIVTVVAYARIPERIPGVRIIAVPKDTILPLRLFRLFLVLIRTLRTSDICLLQNGPSVELPMLLATFFVRTRYIFRIGDSTGLKNSCAHWRTRLVINLLSRRAHHVIHDPALPIPVKNRAHTTELVTPLLRPEILPFAPYPEAAFDAYENSWTAHIQDIGEIIRHVTRT